MSVCGTAGAEVERRQEETPFFFCLHLPGGPDQAEGLQPRRCVRFRHHCEQQLFWMRLECIPLQHDWDDFVNLLRLLVQKLHGEVEVFGAMGVVEVPLHLRNTPECSGPPGTTLNAAGTRVSEGNGLLTFSRSIRAPSDKVPSHKDKVGDKRDESKHLLTACPAAACARHDVFG